MGVFDSTRDVVCPKCKSQMESNIISYSDGDIAQAWYFECKSCSSFFKSLHGPKQVVRNISYMLAFILLSIASLVFFAIGKGKTLVMGAGTFSFLLLAIFNYPKKAYAGLEEIDRDEFDHHKEVTHTHRVIQSHRKDIFPQYFLRVVVIMVMMFAFIHYAERFGW